MHTIIRNPNPLPRIGGYESSEAATQRKELARQRRLRNLHLGFICEARLKALPKTVTRVDISMVEAIVDASGAEYVFKCCGKQHNISFLNIYDGNVEVDWDFLKYLERSGEERDVPPVTYVLFANSMQTVLPVVERMPCAHPDCDRVTLVRPGATCLPCSWH